MQFYIRDFDSPVNVLSIDLTSQKKQIMPRDVAVNAGLKKGLGAFVEEAGHVFGVHASPQGPVLFFDDNFLLAKAGVTTVKVDKDENSGINHYRVYHQGAYVFGTHYAERDGLGTNPYDTAPEDIDLFVMIEKGLVNPQFYRNYTRDSV